MRVLETHTHIAITSHCQKYTIRIEQIRFRNYIFFIRIADKETEKYCVIAQEFDNSNLSISRARSYTLDLSHQVGRLFYFVFRFQSFCRSTNSIKNRGLSSINDSCTSTCQALAKTTIDLNTATPRFRSCSHSNNIATLLRNTKSV